MEQIVLLRRSDLVTKLNHCNTRNNKKAVENQKSWTNCCKEESGRSAPEGLGPSLQHETRLPFPQIKCQGSAPAIGHSSHPQTAHHGSEIHAFPLSLTSLSRNIHLTMLPG